MVTVIHNLRVFVLLLQVAWTSSFVLYNIGIYSICDEKENRSELNKNASMINNYFNQSLKKIIRSSKSFFPSAHDIKYQSFDVCEDKETLVEIIEKLLLDEQYFFKEKDQNINS